MNYDILETNIPSYIVSASEERHTSVPEKQMTEFLEALQRYEEAYRKVELWLRISKAERIIEESKEELGVQVL